MSLKQAMLSGARWTLFARIGLQLITWPITLVVMRLLEPADYGLFAMAMLVSGFITLFSELGMGVALVQAPEVTPEQQRAAASVLLLLNGAIALAIIAVAPLVALVFREPEVTLVMWVLTAELLVSAWAMVPMAMLERALRFREISIAQMAGGIAGAAATLTAAWIDVDVWALVAGALTGATVRTALCVYFHGRLVLPGRLEMAALRPMVKVSSHVIAVRALWYWSGQADQLVLGRMLHTSALGLYNVAAQLAMLPAGKAMEVVNRVTLPVLSRLQDDAAGVRHTYGRLVGLLALYGMGMCWGLAAVAPEFVELVLGRKWLGAAVPLALLSGVAPLRMLCAFNNTVVTACGKPEAATRELLLASVLLPAAVGLGAWVDGLRGASLAWLMAYPAVYLVSVHLTARAIHLHRRDVLSMVWRPLLAGLVMLGVVALLRQGLGPGVPVAWRLAGGIVVGGLAYLATIWLLARALVVDTRELVLDILRPQRNP
jgi:teichuronic acid exporter